MFLIQSPDSELGGSGGFIKLEDSSILSKVDGLLGHSVVFHTVSTSSTVALPMFWWETVVFQIQG